MQKIHTLPPAPRPHGTFESCVVVHPALSSEQLAEALSATNHRARAALSCLIQDALEGPGAFTLNHETVCWMLGAIEGLLDQERALLDAIRDKEVRA